jgi:predicted O-methyltransferase YrrM
MTALTAAPRAPLLDRLFAEVDDAELATAPSVADYWNAFTGNDETRILRGKTEYAEVYSRTKDVPLAVSLEMGLLQYMLARNSRAKSIVEFGTSFGLSTLYLAAALRDNGGGRLITTEVEPFKVARARANLAAGGLADLVEFREGDALETLACDLPETIDLLLLDGAQALYPKILDRVECRLRPGALIVAADADLCPDYLARVRDPEQGYLSMPFAEAIELSMKLS